MNYNNKMHLYTVCSCGVLVLASFEMHNLKHLIRKYNLIDQSFAVFFQGKKTTALNAEVSDVYPGIVGQLTIIRK